MVFSITPAMRVWLPGRVKPLYSLICHCDWFITMTHFGILCPMTDGHMNPMTTLGCELQRRGHRITLFGFLDAQAKTVAAGLEFWAIAKSEYPGVNEQSYRKLR